MISVVILTKNEEKNIERCLRSVIWGDEIVIIDDYSTDHTLPICRKYKTKIFKRKLNDDFASQRNFGLKKAKGEWVLFVDPDEEVDNELKKEILKRVQDDKDGYYIQRVDYFWKKRLRFGEAGGIKLLRLGKKDAGIWKRKVHEYWDIKNAPTLDNSILHYPHPTISEFLTSINHYTDIDVFEQKKFSYFRFFLNPPGKFIYNYIFKLGFLDGMPGLVYAFMMSFHSLVVRVKMRRYHDFSAHL